MSDANLSSTEHSLCAEPAHGSRRDYCFQGSKGILEVTEFGLSFFPQTGQDSSPSYYAGGFPRAMREEYYKQWHQEHDAAPDNNPSGIRSPSEAFHGMTSAASLDLLPGRESRKPVTRRCTVWASRSPACHMANESYFRKAATTWDAASSTIKG